MNYHENNVAWSDVLNIGYVLAFVALDALLLKPLLNEWIPQPPQ